MRKIRNTLIGLAVGVLPPVSFSQGIFHYRPETPIYAYHNPHGPLPDTDLDINFDGTFEFRINRQDVGGQSVTVTPLGLSRIAGVEQGPLDSGSYLFPFLEGESIGSNLNGLANWYAADAPLDFPHAVISTVFDEGGGGLFYGQKAYFGMEFKINGQTHYGWALLNCQTVSGTFLGGGEIEEWAYNTNPNEAILAGAIPEPSTWALLATGTLLFLFRRKKL